MQTMVHLRDSMDKVVSDGWIRSEGNPTRAANVGQGRGLGNVLPKRLASLGVTIGRDTNG